MQKLHADFHNADKEGFVRLNSEKSIVDAAAEGLVFRAGSEILISDGEVYAIGILTEPGEEGIWRVRIDWEKVLPVGHSDA